jgi:hypothetical protein
MAKQRPARRTLKARWQALGGGRAHAEVSALAARRMLKLGRWALGCGKAHVEVAALAAGRTWRSALMD